MKRLFLSVTFLLCSHSLLAESLENLESLQKQAANNLKSAGGALEDLMALDFLDGKLRQFFWLDYYPSKNGQMLSQSFRPRFHLQSYFLAPGELSLVRITESTQNLEVDGSRLASLQKSTGLSNPSEIQVGYISIPTKFPEDYFRNPSSQVARDLDSFESKKVQFLRFIPFNNEPHRVQFIEVKVGDLTSQIPYPEPAFLPPQCEVRLDTPPSSFCQSQFSGIPCIDSDSAQFSLVNTGGVVVSASINDVDLEDNEIPQQTVREVKNEVLKTINISNLRNRVTDFIQEENNPEFSQGLVTISGVVNGPVTSFNPTECQTSIAVRAHLPNPSPDENPLPDPDPSNCSLTVQRDGATQYCNIRASRIGNTPPTLKRGSTQLSGVAWSQTSPETFEARVLCSIDEDSSFIASSTAPDVNRICKLGIRKWQRRIGNGINAHFTINAIPGRNLAVITGHPATSVECEPRSWQRIAFENGFRRYDYPAGGWRALCTHEDGRTNYTTCGDNRHRAWKNNSWGFRPACGEAWTIYLTVYDPLVPNYEVP